eukprot:gene2653-2692_t
MIAFRSGLAAIFAFGMIVSESFRAIEVFICAGAIYLAINFLLTRGVLLLERSLHPDLRGAR